MSPTARTPDDFEAALRKVGEELATSSDRLTFSEVDPGADPALQQQLFDQYGLQPFRTDLLALFQPAGGDRDEPQLRAVLVVARRCRPRHDRRADPG